MTDSLLTLKQQRAALDARIAEETRKGKEAALIKIREMVLEFEINRDELFRSLVNRKAPSVKLEPKYRDPKTGATWTGKGPAPLWLKELEKSGKKRESFLIVTPKAPSAPVQAKAPEKK